MKIRYMSDLHVDTHRGFDVVGFVGALNLLNDEVVVFAGDLGEQTSGVPLVVETAKRARHVVYIPGNREYYSGRIDVTPVKIQEEINKIAPPTIREKITFFEAGSKVIDDVLFVGMTLWTDFQNLDREFMARAVNYIADYSWIFEPGGRPLTPDFILDRHLQERQNLITTLPIERYKVVVVTHHAPSGRSVHPRFATSPINPLFYSDLDGLVENSGACAWIHGHMHDNVDYFIGDTRVLCNPMGYPRDHFGVENAHFNPFAYFEV